MSPDSILYIGDPMCSWCWGIAPAVAELKDRYEDELGFVMIMGGLRPGGGQEWTPKFREFLRHHWQEVSERSGQPFGYELLDAPEFDYDTEPSARSVVVARAMLPEKELEFFAAVQRRFYVDNENPNHASFYEPICADFEIPFETFKQHFESDEAQKATYQEFALNRSWGVQGYPTILLQRGDALIQIASGFATIEVLTERIERARTMELPEPSEP